ncbi:hypothetical protein HMN09_00666300 [Mycena chlorophos]|uniref:F-box domain-containing protein n=1 Tax=Mycena chlorophos TaxID=658473 RepID=A0A8H6T2D0_MYCCL|nr:hypothetical protein HMN09_00666300 [Mycena chlorophos]
MAATPDSSSARSPIELPLGLPSLNEALSDLQFTRVHDLLLDGLEEQALLEDQIEEARITLLDLEQKLQKNKANNQILRTLLAPVRRLPTDVLVEIFSDCIAEDIKSLHYYTNDPLKAPLLLGHVCSLWRNVVLCTPQLWTNLVLHSKDLESPTWPIFLDLGPDSPGIAALLGLLSSSIDYLSDMPEKHQKQSTTGQPLPAPPSQQTGGGHGATVSMQENTLKCLKYMHKYLQKNPAIATGSSTGSHNSTSSENPQ